MDVPTWVWFATIGAFAAVLTLDLFIVNRRPHVIGIGEATRWVIFYIACAVVFGLGIWYFAGSTFALEFFAGYITEYSLSVDNLFIFVIIMAGFAVPPIYQHRVLLIGIVLALIMRGAFIAVGAVLISHFSWVFYLFGALLIYLGWEQLRPKSAETDEYRECFTLRMLRKVVPVTAQYHGAKLMVKRDGKWWVTPMLAVMIAIGVTDLIFAMDSIPAIFGLTKEPFLVFTANAFALMGLRQLYFLIGGLIAKFVYLSTGLGVILAFIGVKLVLEALHENSLPFINGGEPLYAVPTVSIELSLTVILVVLLVTGIASAWKVRRTAALAEDVDEKVG